MPNPDFAWVRDRTTGNRFLFRKDWAEADTTLDLLNVPTDRKLATRPTRKDEPIPEPIIVVAPEPEPEPSESEPDPDPEPKEG